MATLLVSFFIMLSVVAAMAVGVIFKRKPIAGSCGGLSAVGIEGECEICGGDPDKCEEPESELSDLPLLTYDASKKPMS